jgi:hypothetical protein
MYIRLEGDEHILAKTGKGPDGKPQEFVLANLGSDPEINLFLAAERGRREHPELWEGVGDFHVLQALENYKRRIGNLKPALVTIQGRAPRRGAGQDTESEE